MGRGKKKFIGVSRGNSYRNNDERKKPFFFLLTLSKTTDFRLFQTEIACRRPFQIC